MRVERLDGDHLSDVRYIATVDSSPLLIIGFKLECMLTNLVYVTLEPLPGLYSAGPSAWRELRRRFNEISGYKLFCQVENDTAQRFAEFFGFEHRGFAYGRRHLVKETE